MLQTALAEFMFVLHFEVAAAKAEKESGKPGPLLQFLMIGEKNIQQPETSAR